MSGARLASVMAEIGGTEIEPPPLATMRWRWSGLSRTDAAVSVWAGEWASAWSARCI